MVEQNLLHPKAVASYGVVFGLMNRHFDGRPHSDGIFFQNLMGMAKHVKTTQDDRPLASKVSGDAFRTRETLGSNGANIAALALTLDGALSFVPLSHNHRFLDYAGACSSPDFALRIFTNDINLQEWHHREIETIQGGQGRTYSESRVWDDSGKMVASMSQQWPPAKPKAQASL